MSVLICSFLHGLAPSSNIYAHANGFTAFAGVELESDTKLQPNLGG